MLREMDILEDWAAIRKVNLEVFLSEFFFFFGYESCIYFSVFIVLFSNYNCQSVSNKKMRCYNRIFFLKAKGALARRRQESRTLFDLPTFPK